VSYAVSVSFKSHPGDQLSSLTILWFLSAPPAKYQNSSQNFKQDHHLPHTLQFSIA